eukprot:5432301-Alexandrium_andersonii.AAC.1
MSLASAASPTAQQPRPPCAWPGARTPRSSSGRARCHRAYGDHAARRRRHRVGHHREHSSGIQCSSGATPPPRQ